MPKLCFLLLLLPVFSFAHPGIGIVKDSKGNIYYTDLSQVWKIRDGKKTVVVPNVHTHQLYIDQNDNLFGENERFVDAGTNRFDHYLWKLSPDGKLDTVVGMRQAHIMVDFSLARDLPGNEYYTKNYLRSPELGRIYKRSSDGKEKVFAYTPEKRISWLYPQTDGSLLYVMDNNIYRATEKDTARLVARGIANDKPRFWGESPMVYSVWSDGNNNIYAAVFSDQSVKKITPDGKVTEIYRSEKNWAPTHGVFDNDGMLWVLECSKDNEIRVVDSSKQSHNGSLPPKEKSTSLPYVIGGSALLLVVLVFLLIRMR